MPKKLHLLDILKLSEIQNASFSFGTNDQLYGYFLKFLYHIWYLRKTSCFNIWKVNITSEENSHTGVVLGSMVYWRLYEGSSKHL